MDATHLHLILAHFPIVGALIGIMTLAYSQLFKNLEIQKAALSIFVIMSLLTIPVFLTGEEAEESVEHIAGISEQLVENHEELAEKAIWLMGFLGGLSLINLFSIVRNYSFAKSITIATIITSIATFGIFAQVGNLGGQIRHSEIRESKSDSPFFNKKFIEKKRHDDDDDDDDDD